MIWYNGVHTIRTAGMKQDRVDQATQVIVLRFDYADKQTTLTTVWFILLAAMCSCVMLRKFYSSIYYLKTDGRCSVSKRTLLEVGRFHRRRITVNSMYSSENTINPMKHFSWMPAVTKNKRFSANRHMRFWTLNANLQPNSLLVQWNIKSGVSFNSSPWSWRHTLSRRKDKWNSGEALAMQRACKNLILSKFTTVLVTIINHFHFHSFLGKRPFQFVVGWVVLLADF